MVVGRVGGLGLNSGSLSFTLEVDLFYVLVSLALFLLVVIACQGHFPVLLALDVNFGLDSDFDSFQARRCMDTKIPLLSGVVHD